MQVLRGARSEIRLDFKRANATAASDEGREHCHVIARPGPDVHDAFSGAGRAGSQAPGMQRRLPIVDAAVRGKTDKDVLVQQPGIVRDRAQVLRAYEYGPGSRPDIVFAYHS